MGEWTKDNLPRYWMCTHTECGKPAQYGSPFPDGFGGKGACAEHAEAMGVPESLRNPKPTRIHVGWRVVRERDGVREWLDDRYKWVDRREDMPAEWPVDYLEAVRTIAKHHGGRVVKVFLSYGRGR